MRALTIRQPWAGAVLAFGKDVENRKQLWSYRGPLLVHSAHRLADADAFTDVERLAGREVPVLGTPRAGVAWEVGAIVGLVDLVSTHRACTGDRCSPWAQPGHVHLRLSNPRTLTRPVPCNGRLGLWEPERRVMDEVRAALRGAA